MNLNDPTGAVPGWWRDAVCYQVYVRSFADSDGDGVGDLPGITTRLPHLAWLGVDAVWLTPFYASPQHDHGYDVADYYDVDPLFGDLKAAEDLIATAHDLGIRVIVDVVPNHTSDQHAWFQAALAAGPDSPERARYHFREGRGVDGSEPPNNWESVFGGPAWTRITEPATGEPGPWYLHLFDTTQPDLDWHNPEVGDMFVDVLRFWLDRGVDGFRIDVAHGLVKEAGLRDQVVEEGGSPDSEPMSSVEGASMVERTLRDEPMWDQPEVHEIYRRWRGVLDEYGAMAVAEAWTQTPTSMARFVRPDELHQAFNFAWLLADWSAAQFRDVVVETFAATAPVGAAPTWVLSNHDVVRHATRYGGGERGRARARAATLAMLALPGSCYLYQGEELGLEQVDVPPEARQDPSWFRTGEEGRDGCRVPLPWDGEAPPYGFGPGGVQPWLPQPEGWREATVAAQRGRADSTLEFYRAALRARAEHATPAGEQVALAELGEEILAVRRGPLLSVLNCGTDAVALPPGEVVLSSSALTDGGAALPPDTCAWLLA